EPGQRAHRARPPGPGAEPPVADLLSPGRAHPAALAPGQLAAGHPQRARPPGGEPLDLVLLVGLEVALEPEPVRAAFPGQDVCRYPVKEPAVVAGDDRAAGELHHRVLPA